MINSHTFAANYRVEEREGVRVIHMSGKIRVSTHIQENEILETYYLDGDPEVPQVLVLNSHGGEMKAMYGIIDSLQQRNMHIIVTEFCQSLCLLIFADGAKASHRYATKEAVFSFHGASDRYGALFREKTSLYKEYLAEHVNREWMERHDEIFQKTELTHFTGLEMATNGSCFIDSDHLVNSVGDVIERIKIKRAGTSQGVDERIEGSKPSSDFLKKPEGERQPY